MMSQSMTLTVRISGQLSEFVAENVGDHGTYENISEYVRDLIRRDRERAELEGFERIKLELVRGFEAPVHRFAPLSADDVILRHSQKSSK